MPRATDFTRDDCRVGKKRRTYFQLKREWRCADCGGRLGDYYAGSKGEISFNDYNPNAWAIRCAACHSTNFIHERQWIRQQAEAAEVLDALPPELAAQLK